MDALDHAIYYVASKLYQALEQLDRLSMWNWRRKQ